MDLDARAPPLKMSIHIVVPLVVDLSCHDAGFYLSVLLQLPKTPEYNVVVTPSKLPAIAHKDNVMCAIHGCVPSHLVV